LVHLVVESLTFNEILLKKTFINERHPSPYKLFCKDEIGPNSKPKLVSELIHDPSGHSLSAIGPLESHSKCPILIVRGCVESPT
jgi:hypothetical protein